MITGWTFIRFMYLIIGSFIVVQSIMDQQWLGMFIGTYFGAMGLFGLGCASGNCFSSIANSANSEDKNNLIKDIQYEEVEGKQNRQ